MKDASHQPLESPAVSPDRALSRDGSPSPPSSDLGSLTTALPPSDDADLHLDAQDEAEAAAIEERMAQEEEARAAAERDAFNRQVEQQRLQALEALLNRTGQLTSKIADLLMNSRKKATAAAEKAKKKKEAQASGRKRRGGAGASSASAGSGNNEGETVDEGPATKRAKGANGQPEEVRRSTRKAADVAPAAIEVPATAPVGVPAASATTPDAPIAIATPEVEPTPTATPATPAPAPAPAADSTADAVDTGRRRSARHAAKKEKAAEATAAAQVAAAEEQAVQEPEPEEPAGPKLSPEELAELRYNAMFKGELKPYQVDGVEWLYTLFDNGLNGILADEMGLGKTVQTISFLCRIRATVHLWGVTLVVAPLSTLPNWESEFARFAPDINVVLYHGTRPERAELQKDIRKLLSKATRATQAGFMKRMTKEQILRDRIGAPVILTSYEMLNLAFDAPFWRSLQFRVAVIDEGHRLKNSECRLIRNLRMMQTETRYLLTGTPLQNKLAELWSLLNFVMPVVFDDVDSFLSWFDFELEGQALDRNKILTAETSNQLVSKMHALLGPFMLRRVKNDVNLSIPPKKELVIVHPLTQEQRDLFRAIRYKQSTEYFTSLFESFNEPPPKTSSYTVRNAGMALRRVCCHPFLFPHPAFPHEYEPEASLVTRSGKMMLLDQLLHELLVVEAEQKHKVLLFSQFTTFLTLVQYYLEGKGWSHVRLDGNVHHLERKEAIAEFHNNADCKVFLLSTKAGGLGLNLTEADVVILLDSDYNPQNDLQAMDRAHRLGQRRPVTVFRFLSDLENRVYQRAQAKRQLEKMVIGHGKLHDKTGAASVVAFETQTAEDISETDAKSFAETLDQLLQEEDGEKVAVLKEGEDAIRPELLKEVLDKRATWEGVTESTQLKGAAAAGFTGKGKRKAKASGQSDQENMHVDE
ncbi:SNF2 family N-terminal domain-domain-containing protein [Catenaria anguillulae PL171]|uniref:SNF2 family N-terminal domain-domain-containing protein n=1 Tax=Catenaria anguillulae PL171 TaxID=765915 RepID=A0A1Y2HCX2_9FUNG|nr:SNF2 family N-terminal domain-domain-containing protein [Catenaria anguillulae PL171]